ncbi:MAG: GGDEF domain-containing protein [Spirochaetales bacterium]|nr:GGDEF domain-containing protein [Spirochaetales bacterium]
MKNKVLMIVSNGLDNYLDLFRILAKEDFFQIRLLEFDDLLTSKSTLYLRNYHYSDVIIALESSLFGANQEILTDFLSAIYDQKFTNFLILYRTPDFLTKDGLQKGQQNCFYLPEKGCEASLKPNLILYLYKIYHASSLSVSLLDYIKFSFSGIVQEELLKKKTEEIEELNQQLSYSNKIDFLTKLYNRKTIFEFLEIEQKRTRRGIWRFQNHSVTADSPDQQRDFQNKPNGRITDHLAIFTVMMIDVDHFKVINDLYGHLLGDQVLKTLGELFADNRIFRETDLAGRIGGEEFIIILPETNVANALIPARRLMEKIRRIKFRSHDNRIFRVTVSIGMSQYSSHDKEREEIIKRADKALYYAKNKGRNRIVVYEDIDWKE